MTNGRGQIRAASRRDPVNWRGHGDEVDGYGTLIGSDTQGTDLVVVRLDRYLSSWVIGSVEICN
ncbi:MAG: hypothetical protein GY708_08090 [Actinomycetia bacterium]|nr:hypothetical protein [Actinomycetes bacterium]MCP4962812.1 hypothetical protein [Actinomycetes bacterium]